MSQDDYELASLRCRELEAKVKELEALVYVPGLWKCAKCRFSLTARVLYVNQGTVGANNRPQDCANGCGPMWRVTERDAGNALCDQLETVIKERDFYQNENESRALLLRRYHDIIGYNNDDGHHVSPSPEEMLLALVKEKK